MNETGLMMTMQLLRQHEDGIVRRWTGLVLGTYPEEAAAAFDREHDPFANPVGHTVRTSLQGIVQSLADEADDVHLRPYLQELVKLRAIQAFPASEAVGVVFQLKQALRAETDGQATDATAVRELARLDQRIDEVALLAFDVFTECRERVYELRLNEVKRSVPWAVNRMNSSERERIR